MFDFRYHVVSLAAVFLALVIGILVGIGFSGRGLIDDAERENLNEKIAEFRRNETARDQAARRPRRQAAMEDFAAGTYPALVGGRLAGANVAVRRGRPRGRLGGGHRAGGSRRGRTGRAAAVDPRTARPDAVVEALSATSAAARYDERGELDDLGRDLARELAAGGKTPLWDALSDVLVEQRDGAGAPAGRRDRGRSKRRAATRPDEGLPRRPLPRRCASQRARCRGPAGRARGSAIPAFARNGLSTVDSIDTGAGRLALVLLLAGAGPGHYGVEDTATDGVLPPLSQSVATG